MRLLPRRILLLLSATAVLPACGGGSGRFVSQGAPDPGETSSALLGSGQPPVVRIVSPGPGSTVAPGSTVNVQAVAVDPDSIIVVVEFFDGGRSVGARSSPPFVIALGGLQTGAHVLSAVAVDIEGLTAVSMPVTIFVAAPVE